MNMIIPFIALFLPAVTLGETKSIYKIAHVLSRVSKMIHKRKGQKKKKKEIKSTIKLHLRSILDGMQQCNS